MPSTLCLYAYYEKDENYRKNLLFFLENAINDDIDFKFIINGSCSISSIIPKQPNIEVIQRENIGFDFGAYSFYVENNWEIIKQKYTHFIFINASVRGPYGCEKHNWQNDFISMINDRVKLVGNSINILTFYNKQIDGFDFPYPHVQSYMFVMDLECLQFLHDKNIFQNISVNKDDVILQKEILMSLLVLKNGWDINCTLEKYKNIDYKTLKSDINPTSFWGDPSYKNKYFGKTYTVSDGARFFKTDPMRQLLPVERCKSSKFIL